MLRRRGLSGDHARAIRPPAERRLQTADLIQTNPVIVKRTRAPLLGIVVLAAIGGFTAARLPASAAAHQVRGPQPPLSSTTLVVRGQPHIVAQITLRPPGGKGKALGVINVIAQGSLRAFALEATGLAPTRGFAYAVWLFNSRRSALFLGFIDQRVTSNGQAKAIATLPRAASRYRYIIITRETAARPSKPGRIVLRGRLRLGQPSPPDRARDDGAA